MQRKSFKGEISKDSETLTDALAAAPVFYHDRALGQQPPPSAELLREQSDYWLGVLADAPAVLDLPTDRPRPIEQDHAGAFAPLELDETLAAKLAALGRRHGATRFIILLAGWGALLARLSRQDEVVIGTRAAQSGWSEFEPPTGSFVNRLALRLDLSGEQTVGTLIERVKTRVLEAEQHGDLPFEQVVEALGVPRNPSHTPVFQAMFVWRHQNEVGPDFPDLAPSPAGESCRTAKYDLTLNLAECGSRIVGGLEYATALFDRETVERHAGYLRRLLEAMTDGDDQTIDRLPLLGQAERHRLLVEWNATEAEYSRDKCAHEMFEAQVARAPYAIAVRDDETQVTYAELNAQANRLAHGLRALGVGPDAPVAVCLDRSVDMVVVLMAILKAGGAYVPLDPSLPADRLAYMLKDSAPKAVLTQGAARASLLAALDELTEKPRILDLVADASEWAGQPADNLDPDGIGLNPHSLAYIIYTSGSTGHPKGVMVEHGGLVNRLEWMQTAYGLGSQDTVLQKTPFGFDVSVWEFFWTLMEGARLFMAKPGGHKSPAYLSDLIRRENVTTMHFVPSMLQSFVDSGEATDLPSLKRVMCSGEALPIGLVKQFHELLPAVELHNLYGPTEATVDVTAWTSTPGAASDRVPIGRPISNTQIYLLDAHGEPVPRGVAGEIFIGGVNVARGYLNRPDLTAERFLPNPFIAGGRLYKTGDLARFLPNGDIEYLGRNDFQVKIRGFRIELGEIEARLAEHEGIREVVVLAWEIVPGDKRLVAYYTDSVEAEDFDAKQLRDYLIACLPEYMVPAAYVRLDAMPLTPNGKLDRKALPKPEAEAYIARGYVPPEGPTEETLARIWARALGIDRVGRHDNFFELGGHSLLAIRVVTEIEKATGKKVALRTLFPEPTVFNLARDMEAGEKMPGSISLLPLFAGGAGAPIFMVHWIERDLARHLGRRHPVYGLSYGLAGVHGEHDDIYPEGIVAVASHYIEEMRSVQPQGPYRIIGHSAGGLIAYEMAQQLNRLGESVVFLGLLGTYAPVWSSARKILPLHQILFNLFKTPPALLAQNISNRIARSIRARLFRTTLTRKILSAPSAQRIKLDHIIAPPYVPEPYPGLIHLFVETTPPRTFGRAAPPPPESGWKELASGGLDIHYLPGDHMDMVKDPLARVAAEAIERALLAGGDTVVTPTNEG